MKKKVINYIESLGFKTVSHETSPRRIYIRDKVIVTVDDRGKKIKS